MPQAEAVFSDDGRHRYFWRWTWDAEKPRALFVMINPSVANHTRKDPTVHRCVEFVRLWGGGSLAIVNLYSIVDPDLSRLFNHEQPNGPDADRWIQDAAREIRESPTGHWIVCAWGARGKFLGRGRAVAALLGDGLCVLGLNDAGEPTHAKACPSTAAPVPWTVPYMSALRPGRPSLTSLEKAPTRE